MVLLITRGKDKLVLFTIVILSPEGLRPSNSTREEFLSQRKDDSMCALSCMHAKSSGWASQLSSEQ